MKKMILFALSAATIVISTSCNNNAPQANNEKKADNSAPAAANADMGVGSYKNVALTHPLDKSMVEKGQGVYQLKCLACHKLTDEKLVGPGWKGVTDRRTPEYILNFVTNTDEMLEKDANAKALLQVCLVRMPNQHLSDIEARSVLEYMRSNDGKN